MVAVRPCQGTSRIAQTIDTNSGNSGGPIQRAMPIQKPKSFFVNVIGSETNRRLLGGLTMHKTSPCSSGFSLRGQEIGSHEADLLMLLPARPNAATLRGGDSRRDAPPAASGRSSDASSAAGEIANSGTELMAVRSVRATGSDR
jgi:hypothetical protein